jgi:hypothetical protein
MYGFFRIIVLLVAVAVINVGSCHAFIWGGDKSLVTIDDMVLSPDDFRHWWENWKEKDTPLPENLDDFIDWQLLAREAEDMELFSQPRFIQKIDTFLKVRGLMMLKAEEVDAKIRISDAQVREVYDRDYFPIWNIAVLGFAERSSAERVMAGLRNGKLTLEEMYAKAGKNEKDAPVKYDKKVELRPKNMPEGWRTVLEAMTEGAYAGPVEFRNNYLVLHLLSRPDFDQADLDKFRPRIFNTLRKIEQGRLSRELIDRLKQKFHVQIDEGLLDALDIQNPQQELLDKVLVTFDKGEFTASVFVNLVKRNLQRVPVKIAGSEEWKKRKQASLNDLLFQNLTAFEALDRHYEEKEPFKWMYQFYRRHRLIKELESMVFAKDTVPSDEEVRKYYQEHINDYIHPDSVRVAVLQGDDALMDKVWSEISQGADFFKVGKKYFSKEPEVQELRYDHLDESVGEVIGALSPGEVSAPFTVNDNKVMVKLVSKNMREAVPFDQVKKTIAGMLQKKKFQANRDRYLSLLKERSSIKINQKQWKKLHAELSEQNDK